MADQSKAPLYITPAGQLETLAPEDVKYAGSYGYIPATSEQIEKHRLQEKYGTPGQVFETGAEAAGRALTFGLSTHLEKAFGVQPEAIRARQEINPWAEKIGMGLGIAAPAIVSGGAALLPEAGGTAFRGAAELTAPSLIARAGGLGRGLTETALPAGESLASRLATRAAQVGAGSAIEGAAYAGGNVVHEQALGDPHLTAQSAMAQIGLGALLGAGLGGTLGAAEVGLPAAVTASKEAMARLGNKAAGAFREAYPTYAAARLNETPKVISDLISGKAPQLKSPEYRATFAKNLTKGLEDLHDANETTTRTLTRTIRPAERELLLSEIKPEAAIADAQRLVNRIGTAGQELKAQGMLRDERIAAELEQMHGNLLDRLRNTANPAEVYDVLDETKRHLWDLTKVSKAADRYKQLTAMDMKGLYTDFRQGLENEEVWGQAGARQAALNSAQTEHIATTKELMKALGSKTAKGTAELNPTKVDSWLKSLDKASGQDKLETVTQWMESSKKLTDAVEASHKLVKTGDFDADSIRSLVNKTGDNIAEARKNLDLTQAMQRMSPEGGGLLGAVGESMLGHMALGPAGTVLGPAHSLYSLSKNVPRVAELLGYFERFNNKTLAQIESGANKVFQVGAKAGQRSAGYQGANLAKVSDRVQQLATNPTAMEQHLSTQTGGIIDHAPETAKALNVATSIAVAFLASKAPNHPPQTPLAKTLPPNDTEMATFKRYVDAVDKPLSILQHIKEGRLSNEELEALSVVHPRLLEQIKTAVLEKATAQKTLPFQTRLMLSKLFGQDMDGSLRPSMFQSNQMTLMGPSPSMSQGTPGKKPSSSGASKLTISERSKLPITNTREGE